jgi:hypothetical protein
MVGLLEQFIEEELMRVSNVILGTLGAASLLVLTAIGCGSSTTAPTGTGNSTASTSTSGSGASSTGASGTGACAPTAACIATGIKDPDCLGLVDNTGKTKFGLRMSELTITSPPVLASGTVANVISQAVALASTACNLMGSGDFSWLLQFDTTAGTLETGGAKPATNPATGFSFDSEMISGIAVGPITAMVKPDASGKFAMTTGQDIVVPIYATTPPVLLPLKQALINMGTISSNNNCIGKYNSTGLQPMNSCAPDATTPLFVTGATLSGYITLADADNVPISALSESLCVVLAGSANSDGANPAHCVKTGGKITYNGACTMDADCGATAAAGACQASGFCAGMWCSTTNAAATKTSCSDSVELAATFAASSVLIN